MGRKNKIKVCHTDQQIYTFGEILVEERDQFSTINNQRCDVKQNTFSCITMFMTWTSHLIHGRNCFMTPVAGIEKRQNRYCFNGCLLLLHTTSLFTTLGSASTVISALRYLLNLLTHSYSLFLSISHSYISLSRSTPTQSNAYSPQKSRMYLPTR